MCAGYWVTGIPTVTLSEDQELADKLEIIENELAGMSKYQARPLLASYIAVVGAINNDIGGKNAYF